VDDDDAVRKVTRRLLAGCGYDVIEAQTPDEAVRLCEQHHKPIDLLLSDIILPQLSGQELFKRLAPLLPGIKVIFMSGYMSDALLETGLPFLQKPFSGDDLAREVRRVLDL
jgi:CheY-like chemotaxis protein